MEDAYALIEEETEHRYSKEKEKRNLPANVFFHEREMLVIKRLKQERITWTHTFGSASN